MNSRKDDYANLDLPKGTKIDDKTKEIIRCKEQEGSNLSYKVREWHEFIKNNKIELKDTKGLTEEEIEKRKKEAKIYFLAKGKIPDNVIAVAKWK